jgi:hypothetical protein
MNIVITLLAVALYFSLGIFATRFITNRNGLIEKPFALIVCWFLWPCFFLFEFCMLCSELGTFKFLGFLIGKKGKDKYK